MADRHVMADVDPILKESFPPYLAWRLNGGTRDNYPGDAWQQLAAVRAARLDHERFMAWPERP